MLWSLGLWAGLNSMDSNALITTHPLQFRRHRHKEDNPKYSVVPESLHTNETSISGDLQLQLSPQQLKFTVALLEDEVIRVFIEAVDEHIRPRFHPSIALSDPEPKQKGFLAAEKGPDNGSLGVPSTTKHYLNQLQPRSSRRRMGTRWWSTSSPSASTCSTGRSSC